MWPDVSQQLAAILSREIFACLFDTPSYTSFLRSGGLMPPFAQYLKHNAPPFPAAFEGTCRLYGRLITSQVPRNALIEDQTLRAEVVHGPVSLYRIMQARTRGPQPNDLRKGTAYIGDWWFGEDLLEACLLRCRAIEQERKRNPQLTDMTPDRCLRTQLRRRLAIRMDWNALGAIRKLVLASNESIPAITGIGTPQRIYSLNADIKKFPSKELPAADHELPGGDRQLWLPWTPQKAIQLWTPKGGFGPGARL
jgi:hypothetical protein